MRTIRSVNVLSMAKTSGIIFSGLALIFVPFLWIRGLLGSYHGGNAGTFGVLEMIILTAFIPLYGAAGFLAGALAAWSYNLTAKWTGGIEIEIESPRVASFMVPPASQDFTPPKAGGSYAL